MNKWQNKIPIEFYNSIAPTPKVKTVGELISQLERLPKDLPIKQDYPDVGASVSVFNIRSDIGLSLEPMDYD